MADALKKDGRINVAKLKIGKPAPAALVEEAARQAGGVLPAGIAELYREMNGFDLEWEAGDVEGLQGDPCKGLISIQPLYGPKNCDGVFSDWRDSMYFDDEDPKRKIKPFDFFVAEACAVLYPVPGKANIHYHYCGEELHPTGYSVPEYLDRLLVSRGFWYWMRSLCVDLRDSGEVEAFKNDASILFPDYEAALFVPKTKKGELSLD